MRRIVVTGGAGFIGSYLVDGLLGQYPDATIVVLDALTYAGNMANLEQAEKSGRLEFIHGDIRDELTVHRTVKGADAVIHAAAESHVDRSFHNARTFLDTNVTGSHHVFQACRDMEVPRVIHVSTDEVYGPRQDHEEADENAVLMPTNPYSASKAAAEMLARAAWKAYGTPIVLVRPNNIYGARQFPEKLIPRFVLLAASDKVLTIHGSGLQRRRFLAVEDVVSGIITVLEKGAPGETYNIGTNDTYSVLEVADLICATFGKKVETLVRHVENRPFNDDCYATDTRRLRAMGWAPRRTLRADLASLSQEIRHLNTVREQTPEVAIEAAEAWSS